MLIGDNKKEKTRNVQLADEKATGAAKKGSADSRGQRGNARKGSKVSTQVPVIQISNITR